MEIDTSEPKRPEFHPYSPIIEKTSQLSSIAQTFSEEKNLNQAYPTHQRIMSAFVIISITSLLYLVHNYDELQLQYPPHVITVLIGSISSVLAQLINQLYKRQYNLSHIMKFLVWGCINGVMTSMWIDMLIFQFPHILVRVLVDQLIGSPSFQLAFLVLNATWDNNKDIFTYLKINYVRSLKFSYLIWPSFSLLSFSILPPHLIFPCNCLVNLIWSVILSFIS